LEFNQPHWKFDRPIGFQGCGSPYCEAPTLATLTFELFMVTTMTTASREGRPLLPRIYVVGFGNLLGLLF
jgi:hypothetical protein